ncbi:hypothetical protein QTP88_015259 [Uroleucon formosanum]
MVFNMEGMATLASSQREWMLIDLLEKFSIMYLNWVLVCLGFAVFGCVLDCSEIVGEVGQLDDGRDLLICSLGGILMVIDWLSIFEF